MKSQQTAMEQRDEWSLSSLLGKYLCNAKYFVETGTHLGGGLKAALDVGFEKYFSVELSSERYAHCCELFKDEKHIFLSNDHSVPWLRSVINTIDKKSLFWLDAHGEGGGAPVFEELDIIDAHHIKTHTIIIDDIPIYYGDGTAIAKRCLEINPNYKTALTPNGSREDYIFVAWVEENEE